MPPTSETSTALETTPPASTPARERILDAAESLFAEGGLEAMSMRAITAQAGVNLAAVNYHFGSKHLLVVAMVRRRFEPINARRLERLEAAVTLARPGTPLLEDVVDAFLEPVLTLEEQMPVERASSIRSFIGRVMFLPPDVAADVYRESFDHLVARFHAVLQETLPDVPAGEILFRMHLALGPLARVLVCGTGLLPGFPADASAFSDGRLRVGLREFICAGLAGNAPAGN